MITIFYYDTSTLDNANKLPVIKITLKNSYMHGEVKLINVLQIEFVSIKIEKNIDDNE